MRQHSVVNPSWRAFRIRLRVWTSSKNLSWAEFGTNWTALPALSVIQYRFDSRQRGSRNWSRLTRIVELAAMARDPCHEPGDRAVGREVHVGVGRRLLPARPGLEPKDRRRDRLRAVAGRLPEQAFCDLGVRLDLAAVELVAIMALKCRLADADDLADLVLRHPIGGKRLDLLAVGLGRLVGRAPGSLRHGAQAA